MEMQRISAGGVILNNGKINNGKVAIVYQSKSDTQSFPKGHVKPGEKIFNAAKREILEETGLLYSNLNFRKEFEPYERGHKGDPTIKKKIHMYLFLTKKDELVPIDKRNNPEANWVSIDEVVNELSYKEDRQFFMRIKNELKKYC